MKLNLFIVVSFIVMLFLLLSHRYGLLYIYNGLWTGFVIFCAVCFLRKHSEDVNKLYTPLGYVFFFIMGVIFLALAFYLAWEKGCTLNELAQKKDIFKWGRKSPVLGVCFISFSLLVIIENKIGKFLVAKKNKNI